jgi:hypothetical protein
MAFAAPHYLFGAFGASAREKMFFSAGAPMVSV